MAVAHGPVMASGSRSLGRAASVTASRQKLSGRAFSRCSIQRTRGAGADYGDGTFDRHTRHDSETSWSSSSLTRPEDEDGPSFSLMRTADQAHPTRPTCDSVLLILRGSHRSLLPGHFRLARRGEPSSGRLVVHRWGNAAAQMVTSGM